MIVEEIGGKGGGANMLDGKVKHVVLYNKILTAAERTLLVEWSQQYIG